MINKPLHQGIRVNVIHFARSCAVADIQEPFLLSDNEIQSQYDACLLCFFELEAIAKMLVKKHLSQCYLGGNGMWRPQSHDTNLLDQNS